MLRWLRYPHLTMHLSYQTPSTAVPVLSSVDASHAQSPETIDAPLSSMPALEPGSENRLASVIQWRSIGSSRHRQS